MSSPQILTTLQPIAKRLSQLPEVEAVAVAGSFGAGRSTSISDIDLYAYVTSSVAAETRLSIGREFSADAQLVDYWGAATVWTDASIGREVEVMFFTVQEIEDLVLQSLEHHQPRSGYTTSFWHTIRVSQMLYDRNGWFAGFQKRVDRPFPEPLRRAIVNHNYPLLRDAPSSHREQLTKATKYQDVVSSNRLATAFLESYFDVLFAVNRIPNPGEKRLLSIVEEQCAVRPQNMREDVTQFITACCTLSEDMLTYTDKLVDDLAVLLNAEDLL